MQRFRPRRRYNNKKPLLYEFFLLFIRAERLTTEGKKEDRKILFQGCPRWRLLIFLSQ